MIDGIKVLASVGLLDELKLIPLHFVIDVSKPDLENHFFQIEVLLLHFVRGLAEVNLCA